MNTITVRANEEYMVKIAHSPVEGEFFYEAYEQAKHELEEIIISTQKYRDSEKQYQYGVSTTDFIETSNDYINNIIAFSGDRGQGKSSAMLSFSNFIKNRHKSANQKFFSNNVVDSNFVILDRIDPTKFEQGDDILTIILAKLFNQFCALWKISEKKNIKERGELLEFFESCYKEIDAIKIKHNEDDYSLGSDLEKLSRIGDSANLKNHFLELIEKFFKFYCLVKELDPSMKKNFLVIQLDDTDLSINKAREIVEDLRKYFMIPNVVIIMAAHLHQLTYAIEQSYMNEFSILKENYRDNSPINYHKIAVKYIDKLIPGRRKIYLPNLKATTEDFVAPATIKYVAKDEMGKDYNILYFEDNNNNAIVDAQELLFRFIYQKTGLVFIKPRHYLHNIIPTNMRELVNFLSVLNNMKDIPVDNTTEALTDIKSLQQRMENLELFENYFINTWVPSYIETEYAEIIESLIATPWTIKSKQLVNSIKDKFASTSDDYEGYYSIAGRIDDIIDGENRYSFAKIRELLSFLDEKFPYQKVFKLTFAIRVLYSICMSKMICNNLTLEGSNIDYDRWNVMDFIGGDIFGDSVSSFIRTEGDSGLYRANFDINYDKLSKENKMIFDEMLKNKDSLFLLSVFVNFEFKRGLEKQLYKVHYKSGNNRVASIMHFNVTYPIIQLIHPDIIFEKVDLKNEYTYYFSNLRRAFIEIVSSFDLIYCLDRNLSDYSKMRSKSGWKLSDYVLDFYDRLTSVVHLNGYLPIRFDILSIKNLITNNSELLDKLYDFYLITSKESHNSITVNAEMVFQIQKLKTLMKTQTFEILKTRIEQLDDEFSGLIFKYNADISNEYNRLNDLRKKVEGRFGTMDDEDRVIYQKAYNDIVRDVKNKYSIK